MVRLTRWQWAVLAVPIAFWVSFVLIAAGGLLFWNLYHVTSPIRISNPRAVLAADGEGPAAIYLTFENTGGPDVLKAMSSPASEHVMIMGIDEDRTKRF